AGDRRAREISADGSTEGAREDHALEPDVVDPAALRQHAAKRRKDHGNGEPQGGGQKVGEQSGIGEDIGHGLSRFPAPARTSSMSLRRRHRGAKRLCSKRNARLVATKMTTRPWMESTTVVGTPTARCMMLAPLRKPPRKRAANIA